MYEIITNWRSTWLLYKFTLHGEPQLKASQRKKRRKTTDTMNPICSNILFLGSPLEVVFSSLQHSWFDKSVLSFHLFFSSNADLPSYHSDGWEFLKEIDQMIPVRDSLNDLNLPACKSQLNYLGEQISPKSLSKN